MVSIKATYSLAGAVAFNAFVSIIYVPFVKFPIRITSDNTGSSQNVSIPAKGEPLTVLATPIFIIKYRRAFSYEFLRNGHPKFEVSKLAIFAE